MNGLFRTAVAAGLVAFLATFGLVLYRIRNGDLVQMEANRVSIETLALALQDRADLTVEEARDADALERIADALERIEVRMDARFEK